MSEKMLEGIENIFDEMQSMMKKLKKTSYEENMKRFRDVHGHYFSEMTAYMEQAEDKKAAAKEIAASFVEQVEAHFKANGKINGRTQADMNFFMIYYTFPAILLTGGEYGKTIADAVCNEWGNCFRDSKIGYADYDTIYKGFREKIFGLF